MQSAQPQSECQEVDHLPLNTRFSLVEGVTDTHRSFLKRHGFLIFGGVFQQAEVNLINEEVDRIREEWVSNARNSIRWDR